MNDKFLDKKELDDAEIASQASQSSAPRDQTHRKLKASRTTFVQMGDETFSRQSRHVQLIGIGGTVGTALFVQIGSALTQGGPASLFLAFAIWSTFILAINNCLSEMVTWIPISSPFVRFADNFVDPALGFTSGINFFVFEAALVPFEVVAFNLVLQFWTDKIPVTAVIVFVLVCYVLLNVFAVGYYGEAEFWLSVGKVILAVGLIAFTFITMIGGNPLHDTYGFRSWDPSKVPGAPFAENIKTGSLGRFLGFLTCLIQASFTIAGPDYVSMTAGETELPRKTLPRAFNGVFYRLTTFFVVGTLCVGIVVPYNDPTLLDALSNALPGAGSSPYVIAMQRMQIPVLPHIVNAMILTSIFSAGEDAQAVFSLHETWSSHLQRGCHFRYITALQVSNNSAVVLQWFVNLVTASQLLNYAIISFTYLKFYYALRAQGFTRSELPHKSFWQPFCGYYALVGTSVMAFVGGYTVFLPGNWDVPTFLFSYCMLGLAPILFLFWKVFRRTKWQRSQDITFLDKEREQVDAYEEAYVAPITSGTFNRIMDFLFS
ncbi:unnamed protein product [Mycena citricolor]|uniref:Amino acid permease/ SLC12A domain-containing protein n=1 Tax=Mycena citricolor TaxID=2018698 RepID=A0AAD2HJH5_9AGAR|nr:unnamed protein product [Mycena citricolor]